MTARAHGTFDHPADMGVFGRGPSLAAAFEEAAAAMFELVVRTDGLAAERGRLRVSCSAVDREELLVEFLNELVAEADLADMAFLSVEIESIVDEERGWRLDASAAGVGRARLAGRLLGEVKAATPSGVRVVRRPDGGWEAACLLDM